MTDQERDAIEAEHSRKLDPTELAQMLEAAKVQGIHLRKCPSQEDAGADGCWFGGEPTLPDQYDWPWFTAHDELKAPMHFLGQINLASVPHVDGTPPLPKVGTLFFFYDPMVAPAYETPPGSGKVIYCPDDVSGALPRKMPPLPKHVPEDEISYEYQMHPTEQSIAKRICPAAKIPTKLHRNSYT